MKKYKWIVMSLCLGMALTGCQDNKATKNTENITAEDNKKEITGSFSIISDSGKTVEAKDNTDDAEITILLNNASINNSSASPINIICADNVKIKSEENSYNEINDTRAAKETEDTNDNAAVYSKVDLSLTGKGSLVINATYITEFSQQKICQ